MKPIDIQHNIEGPLGLKRKNGKELEGWLTQEIIDAESARKPADELWRELLRMYEGVPKREIRNTPIVNAPNLEVTIGGIASDSIFAQVVDLIYQSQPVLTVRAVTEDQVPASKAMQRFVDWLVENEIDMRRATENAFLDCIQLGTGVFYVPWVERQKKTAVSRVKQTGSIIRCVPIEDFLVPGGTYDDLQEARWCAMRVYLTRGELEQRAKQKGWDIGNVKEIGAETWVRHRREQMGRTSRTNVSTTPLYEILDVYVYYDIDGDGFDEDLLVTYDKTAMKVLKVDYNPYDRRPFEAMRYQLRPHLFYGIGVLEMMKPYQEGVTELYNHWMINLMIANARVWKGREGAVPATMELWPNKIIPLTNPQEDLMPEQMGDVYPSAPQAVYTTTQFAVQRVGMNDLLGSAKSPVLGTRTPGITAMTAVQQMNRRFTPAFDAMRLATACAVRQCLYRYQERIMAGDPIAVGKVTQICGDAAPLVLEVLQQPIFDDRMVVELTASSVSVNREADRQNAILLATQILVPYYQQVIQLAMVSTQPMLPDPVRNVVMKVAAAMAEGVDAIVRNFENVRNPTMLAVNIMPELQALRVDPQQQIMQMLQGIATQMGGQGNGTEAQPTEGQGSPEEQ